MIELIPSVIPDFARRCESARPVGTFNQGYLETLLRQPEGQGHTKKPAPDNGNIFFHFLSSEANI
jgi:hypothetical protein